MHEVGEFGCGQKVGRKSPFSATLRYTLFFCRQNKKGGEVLFKTHSSRNMDDVVHIALCSHDLYEDVGELMSHADYWFDR